MRPLFWRYSAYQSECRDHLLHERHCVSAHWCRQAGHIPPVSNVFHSFPHVQNHLSSLRGNQPQSGQRMRGGSEVPGFSSSSSSRSGVIVGVSVMRLMLLVQWILSSSPSVLLFFPITRTSLPRRPAYLIAMPRSAYSSSW